MAERIVCISYSHANRSWLGTLRTHLRPLLRGRPLVARDDNQIPHGSNRKNEIFRTPGEASAAILLVTPEFLASRFIHEFELPAIYEAAWNRGLRVLRIPVKSSGYKSTPIQDFQPVHFPFGPCQIR